MTEELGGEAFWDARYGEKERIWSGKPNGALISEVEGMTPGRALDLGCGEGADAIWLAERGWHVTGVDISTVALDRAAAHAADNGVAERITWRRLTLGDGFPEGSYDLIISFFLHSHGDLRREDILRAATSAVAPGGVLLVVGHAGHPVWSEHRHRHEVSFPSASQVLADLDLVDEEWEVLRCHEYDIQMTRPDGVADVRSDNTVKVRRRA
ncbi:SAM-dependent methyltransferase [Stackebrandtia soli]|uniref:SAM-dependent methyltransferase n=1 Tax=Stackebrandtia soli TaxID=1892856 RepID=UPI0039E7A3FF